MAPITPHITDHIWRKVYGRSRTIHKELFPKPKKYRIDERVSQSIIEFNTEIWKSKREKGLAMKDTVTVRIPLKLRPFQADMVRMHHITETRADPSA
jgi:valyl-tRNA synthetase